MQKFDVNISWEIYDEETRGEVEKLLNVTGEIVVGEGAYMDSVFIDGKKAPKKVFDDLWEDIFFQDALEILAYESVDETPDPMDLAKAYKYGNEF